MQRTLSENSAMHNKNNTNDIKLDENTGGHNENNKKSYRNQWNHWQAQRKQQEII